MGPLLAIPAAIAGGGSIVTGGGVGAFLTAGSFLTSNLALGVIGLGATVALSALLRPEMPEPASGQIELQQAVPPRTFVYGRMEVSGAIGFKRNKPATSILHKIILLHDGRIDGFETLKLDDIICLLDGSGYVTNGFIHDAVKRVQIFLHDGHRDQTVDTTMLADFPGIWTSDHRLRGIAYAVVLCHGVNVEGFMDAYANGEPTFKATIRGRRLYDPRDASQALLDVDTWIWSDNAALALLDWIAIHPKGYRIPLAKVDVPSFIALANRCDEVVALKLGGSEKRYRIATQVSLKEKRTAVLQRLREACDAHLYPTSDGKWAVRGGAWSEPAVTLDAKLGHWLDLEMRDGQEATSRYNELVLRFLNPDNGYAESECDPWQITDDIEFLAGKVKSRPLDLLQVPSYTQARRLAKLMAAYDNPAFIGSGRTNFYGLNVIGERNMTLSWSEWGESTVSDGPFWVERDLAMSDDGAGVQMRLRSAKKSAYAWNPQTEEGNSVPLLPPTDLDTTYTEGTPPSNPADFAVTGGVKLATATWTPPSTDAAWYIARLWRAGHYGNSILHSDAADNAAWTKTAFDAFGSGSVADTTDVTDPLGTNTADFLRPTTVSTVHQIVQTVTGHSPNQTSSYQRWLRYQPSGTIWIQMRIDDASSGTHHVAAFFNIRDGTIGNLVNGGAGSGATASIAVQPDGWLLCSLTGKPNTAGTNTRASLYTAASNGVLTNAGDGVHGLYVWRAQLEVGSTPHQPLIPTTTAAVTHNVFANAVQVSGPRVLPRTPGGAAVYNPMTQIDPVSPGTYDYFLTSENPVGDRATPLGPAHVTVTAS